MAHLLSFLGSVLRFPRVELLMFFFVIVTFGGNDSQILYKLLRPVKEHKKRVGMKSLIPIVQSPRYLDGRQLQEDL